MPTHKCETCGKTLSRSTKLTEHVRTHTREKPFKCVVCGTQFSRSYDLTKHKALHSGSYKYRCKGEEAGVIWGCGKGFHKRGDLNRHLRRDNAKQCRGRSLETTPRDTNPITVPVDLIDKKIFELPESVPLTVTEFHIPEQTQGTDVLSSMKHDQYPRSVHDQPTAGLNHSHISSTQRFLLASILKIEFQGVSETSFAQRMEDIWERTQALVSFVLSLGDKDKHPEQSGDDRALNLPEGSPAVKSNFQGNAERSGESESPMVIQLSAYHDRSRLLNSLLRSPNPLDALMDTPERLSRPDSQLMHQVNHLLPRQDPSEGLLPPPVRSNIQSRFEDEHADTELLVLSTKGAPQSEKESVSTRSALCASTSTRHESVSPKIKSGNNKLDFTHARIESLTNPSIVGKQPPFILCHFCKKRFTCTYDLRAHLRTHIDAFFFACTFCGKTFDCRNDRNRHEVLHGSEKPYVCRGTLRSLPGQIWGCGRRYAQIDALGRHLRSDAGRKCIAPLIEEEAAEQRPNATENLSEDRLQEGY